MSELQAYYSRLANNTYNRSQYMSACASPAITDASLQMHVIERCGILTSTANTASDLSGCISTSEASAAFKDILCARYDSTREQTSENAQRTRDLETLLWMERDKMAFRGIGIVGLFIGYHYFIR